MVREDPREFQKVRSVKMANTEWWQRGPIDGIPDPQFFWSPRLGAPEESNCCASLFGFGFFPE